MRISPIYLFVLALALVAAAALASAGLAVSAQNSNSSTTMTPAKPKPHKKKMAPAMPKCDNTKQEQTDLSGTYTGKLKHGDDPVADATLTITGNTFTGTMGGKNVSGRIVAVTTCGYTAVTIMHDGEANAMSLRAKKIGDNLTLTSVPGEPRQVTFTTGGSAMKAKVRKHRAKPKATTGAPPPPPPKKM